MVGKISYSLAAILFGLLLSSCQKPETPLQVSQHFWQAVIEDNPNKVVEYSTLEKVKDYDGFSMDWTGFQAGFGIITIDGKNAGVESTFTPAAVADQKTRNLTTYLVMQNEIWKVDYLRTSDAMKPKKSGGLIEKLNRIGKTLSEQLDDSSDELNRELEQLGEKLEELSDQVGSEAAESIGKFAEELEKSLEELQESIDRSLKDKRKQSPEQGDGSLQEI